MNGPATTGHAPPTNPPHGTRMPHTSAEAFGQARTELALRIAAKDLSTHAAAAVIAPPATAPDRIAAARRLAVLEKRYKTMAVLAARIVDRAPWDDIGHALGVDGDLAARLYADAETRWLDGDPAPWAPVLANAGLQAPTVTGVHPIDITPDNIAAVTAELRRFTDRYGAGP